MDMMTGLVQDQGDLMPLFLYAFWAPIHENLPVQVMILAVAVLIILDFASGMLGAIVNKNWDSSKIRQGLAHKSAEFGFLIVGDVIDAMLFAGIDLQIDIPNGCALGFVALSIILMEISSIMENAVRIDSNLGKNRFFQLLASAKVIEIESKEKEAEDVEDEPDGAHAAR